MKSVYLAGPILGKTVAEANDWRAAMSLKLARFNILGISPLRCEPPGINGVYEGSYDDPKFGHMRAIASKNLFDVRNCDVTLAYLPLSQRLSHQPSIGTLIELAYAHALGKSTILVTDDPTLLQHPLVQMCAGWVLPDLESAVELLKGLLEDYAG